MSDSDKDADCLDLHDLGIISNSHEREDRMVASRKKCHKDKNKLNQPKKSILGKRKGATGAPSSDKKTTCRKKQNIVNESKQRGKYPESQRKQSDPESDDSETETRRETQNKDGSSKINHDVANESDFDSDDDTTSLSGQLGSKRSVPSETVSEHTISDLIPTRGTRELNCQKI